MASHLRFTSAGSRLIGAAARRMNRILGLAGVVSLVLGSGAAPAQERQAQGAPKAGAAADKAAAAANLPPAAEIIARFVKAVGGREAVLKHDSQRIKGVYEMPAQGIKAPLEVVAAKPNKMFIKIRIPGFGDVLSGYDGKVGWSINAATGPMVLQGTQLEQIKEQAEYASVLHEAKNFSSMQTVEEMEFEGRKCYKLRLVRAQSKNELVELFDKETGLIIGMVAEQESPMGRMSVTSVLGDYKPFEGVMYATRNVQKLGAFEQIILIESVEFGNVPDSAFDLPEPIKALLDGGAPAKQ